MFNANKSTPKGPRISFAPNPARPAPSAPTDRSSTSYTPSKPAPTAKNGGARVTTLVGEPEQRKIKGDWYCQVNRQNEVFIVSSVLQIAEEFNCHYVGIRAGVHNTETSKDPQTGKTVFIKAPWHFTAEFQHRVHGRWMSAHIYTDTETIVGHNYRYHKTHGKAKLEHLKEKYGITENPQRFPFVNPKVLVMKKKGEPFEGWIKGYKPKNW